MRTDSSFGARDLVGDVCVSHARPPLIRRSARIRSASARGISATERRLPLGSDRRLIEPKGTFVDEVAGRLELARAELSDLQQTIRHYDTILLQVKSWAITTAVAAGGFALNLTRPGIAMLGLLATAAFFLIDGVYRTYLEKTVVRSLQIETALAEHPLAQALMLDSELRIPWTAHHIRAALRVASAPFGTHWAVQLPGQSTLGQVQR